MDLQLRPVMLNLKGPEEYSNLTRNSKSVAFNGKEPLRIKYLLLHKREDCLFVFNLKWYDYIKLANSNDNKGTWRVQTADKVQNL